MKTLLWERAGCSSSWTIKSLLWKTQFQEERYQTHSSHYFAYNLCQRDVSLLSLVVANVQIQNINESSKYKMFKGLLLLQQYSFLRLIKAFINHKKIEIL